MSETDKKFSQLILRFVLVFCFNFAGTIKPIARSCTVRNYVMCWD